MRFRLHDYFRLPLDRILMSAAVLTFSTPAAFGGKISVTSMAPTACRLSSEDRIDAVQQIREISRRVVDASFPKLNGSNIDIKAFESPSTFFKTRFSISRYMTFRGTRIILSVNPCVFKLRAPVRGIEAIIAHELVHAENYIDRNLFQRVSLVKLAGANSLARFGRRTDLVAIERGYGNGLREYREWLYLNIPPDKVEKKGVIISRQRR